VDLGLDGLARAMTEGGGVADVGPLLYATLPDADAVAYRHEVFRDLELPGLAGVAGAFCAGIGETRAHLDRARRLVHRLERDRWVLEAACRYRETLAALAAGLEAAPVASRALRAVAAELATYRGSAAYLDFDEAAGAVSARLARVRYRLRITEHRVTVARAGDEADYGAEVLATFDRFRRSEAPAARTADVFATDDMNPVEAAVLERVVRLDPGPFRALEAFAATHGAFLEPALVDLARELAFYLGYRAVVAPVQVGGLDIGYPEVGPPGSGIEAHGLFDLALARRRVAQGEAVVTNDVALGGGEWLAVVTGPTSGGKTTFARALGQLAHLAAAGCPVPARSARLGLVDRVHTHFDRPEDPADLAGRLEAELRRLRAILDELTPASLLVMNESLSSTTEDDALALWHDVLGRVRSRAARCVVVAVIAELADLEEDAVSLVCLTDPDDPGRPTFRVARRPADGLLHARLLVERHRLGYDAVRGRVAR
jgi:DNA mismatch repair protein MutS